VLVKRVTAKKKHLQNFSSKNIREIFNFLFSLVKKFAIFFEVDFNFWADLGDCLGYFPGAQQAVLPKTVSLFPENQEKDNLENAKQFLEEQLVGRRGSTLNQGWAKLAPTLQLFLFDTQWEILTFFGQNSITFDREVRF
jgi:hypothetical protein